MHKDYLTKKTLGTQNKKGLRGQLQKSVEWFVTNTAKDLKQILTTESTEPQRREKKYLKRFLGDEIVIFPPLGGSLIPLETIENNKLF